MTAYSSLWDLLNHGLLHRWLYTHSCCFCSALGLGFVEEDLRGRLISLHKPFDWGGGFGNKNKSGDTLVPALSGTSELVINSEESQKNQCRTQHSVFYTQYACVSMMVPVCACEGMLLIKPLCKFILIKFTYISFNSRNFQTYNRIHRRISE